MLVEGDVEEPVVQRLHPVVVELEVPVVAGGRGGLDHQRLVGLEPPVGVVVGDVGVAPHRVREIGVEAGELVDVLLEALGPGGEEGGRGPDEGAGLGEAPVEGRGSEGDRLAGAVDPLDRQLGGHLAGAIEEGLADDQGARLGLHGEPVAGPGLAADEELEPTVVVDREIPGLDVARGGHAPALAVVPDLGGEPEVVDGAPGAPDPVRVAAGHGRVQVEVVGVVGAHLRRLVDRAQEHGGAGVDVLDEALEGGPGEAAEVAVALRPVEGTAGRAFPLDDGPRRA